MSEHYVATLLIGSGLGSTLLGVVFALVYLKKNNINSRLKVNIQFASSPAKVFFQSLKTIHDIEIVNMPVINAKINGVEHVITPSLNGLELFHAPGIPGYALFKTDFEVLKEVFISFWKKLDLFNYSESEYVCLHIRRGDKLIYEKSLKVHALETYIEQLHNQKLHNYPIIIVTDEYDTFLNFKKIWSTSLVATTSTLENKGFNITTINSSCHNEVEIEVENMIRDFNVIYNSKYFIGTKSSCVSLIGRLILDENKVFILQ
jgi:hypothetical protein